MKIVSFEIVKDPAGFSYYKTVFLENGVERIHVEVIYPPVFPLPGARSLSKLLED
jgi:hypothetical protein